jgi:hypothetical protein
MHCIQRGKKKKNITNQHPLPGSAVHMEPRKDPLPSVRGTSRDQNLTYGGGPKTPCASSLFPDESTCLHSLFNKQTKKFVNFLQTMYEIATPWFQHYNIM